MITISVDIVSASHRAQFLDGAASAADELAAVLDGLVGKTYTRRYAARMPEGVAFVYREDYGIAYFEAWYTAPGTPNGGYCDPYSGRTGLVTIVDARTDSRVIGADLPEAVRGAGAHALPRRGVPPHSRGSRRPAREGRRVQLHHRRSPRGIRRFHHSGT